MGEFVPNKNATESSKLDQRSIRFIKNLLPDDDVDCSQLHEGGMHQLTVMRFMISLNQFTHIRSGIRAKSLFLLLVTPKVKSSIGDI